MKKTNIIMTLIILCVTILTFSIGTYAYFTMNLKDERNNENNSNTFIKTCKLAEATIVSDVPEALGSFITNDIYPGHKEVITMSVTSKGEVGSVSNFAFVYNILENTLGDNIKVAVYQSNEAIKTTTNYFSCTKVSEKKGDESIFFEKCIDKDLGDLISETTLHGGQEEVVIAKDSLGIIKEGNDKTKYYHIVIEFLNKEEGQNMVMNAKLNGKVTVTPTTEKNKYKESILNGVDPVIKDELIPVIIESDGTVRRADEASEWYNYKEKKWANAIILKNKDEVYCPGEIIKEDAIESYFVWIPKYRYELWDLGEHNDKYNVDNSKVHSIPVIFGDYNTKDEIDHECTTVSEGKLSNCKVGDYMTHPAFLSIPSTGFWVGKYETSKSNNNQDNSINPDGVQIKPNELSWRNINVSNAFYTTYNYKRNLDSHMMKNTEWGAVAYLSHSLYGNTSSIRFNNNSDYKTGYASIKEPTCGWEVKENQNCNRYGSTLDVTLPYNTEIGYLASTTKNITGIYDMAGGSWEYVMGAMLKEDKTPITGPLETVNSGFNGAYSLESGKLTAGYNWPLKKYYDTYGYSAVEESYTNYSFGTLGDATGELGPFKYPERPFINSWYSDMAWTLFTEKPWIGRGGYFNEGNNSGVFALGSWTGAASDFIGFRVILAP